MNLEKIKEQYEILRDSWSAVYDAASSSPSTYEPHIPDIDIHDLNDMIYTLGFWIDRTKAPSRLGKQFWLVSSALGSSLFSLNKTVKNLQAAQYGHFPTFVTQLSQVYGILHSMVALARAEGVSTASDLAGALAEAHTELQNVADDLKNKIELCNEASEWNDIFKQKANEATELADSAKELIESTEAQSDEFKSKANEIIAELELNSKTQLSAVVDTCQQLESKAKLSSKTISVTEEQVSTVFESTEELRNINKELQDKLVEQQSKLEELQQASEQLKQQIEGLLPGAASAGLAHAFSARADLLEGEKKFWLWCFSAGLLSILLATVFAYVFLPAIDFKDPKALLAGVLLRLPFLGPFIWFAWYSAVQYGNRLRVQEDYAFKKATAEAFIGYRDHMEHLCSVGGTKEGNTALTALATKTVEVLSNEPLRIYKDTHDEAAPITKIIGIVNRVVGGEKK